MPSNAQVPTVQRREEGPVHGVGHAARYAVKVAVFRSARLRPRRPHRVEVHMLPVRGLRGAGLSAVDSGPVDRTAQTQFRRWRLRQQCPIVRVSAISTFHCLNVPPQGMEGDTLHAHVARPRAGGRDQQRASSGHVPRATLIAWQWARTATGQMEGRLGKDFAALLHGEKAFRGLPARASWTARKPPCRRRPCPDEKFGPECGARRVAVSLDRATQGRYCRKKSAKKKVPLWNGGRR